MAAGGLGTQDDAANLDALLKYEAEAEHGTFAVDLQLLSTGAQFRIRGRPRLPVALTTALHSLSESLCTPPSTPETCTDAFVFALKDYDVVAETIAPEFAARSSIVEIPAEVRRLVARLDVEACSDAYGVSATVVAAAIGRKFWDDMFQFQRDGVLKAVRQGGRVLLADSMGLGKTVSALAIAEYFRVSISEFEREGSGPDGDGDEDDSAAPVLILCPSTLRETWVHALSKWLPKVPATAVHCMSSSKDAKRFLKAQRKGKRDLWDRQLDVQFVICSYDLLPRLLADLSGVQPSCDSNSGGAAAALAQVQPAVSYEPTTVPPEMSIFSTVIADECHTLKNSTTARARACVPVILAARYRILISGTPVTSHPGELFTQLQALLGVGPAVAPFLPPELFLHRYCGGSNFAELNSLLSMVMIRRSKEEAGIQLPPKIRCHSRVELSSDRRAEFTKMLADRTALGKSLADASCPEEVAMLRNRLGGLNNKLFKDTAQAKILFVLTRLRELLLGPENKNRKLLLFAFHQNVLDAVAGLCHRECLRFVRIDGSVHGAARGPLVNLFQEDPNTRIAILSIQTAGTGLTLTKANYVMFAELNWVPSNLSQAEDRAHRIGQESVVHVEYVVAPETLDMYMFPTIRRKLGMMGKLVDGVGHDHVKLDPDVHGTTVQYSDLALRATAVAAADGGTWNTVVPTHSQHLETFREREAGSHDPSSSQRFQKRVRR